MLNGVIVAKRSRPDGRGREWVAIIPIIYAYLSSRYAFGRLLLIWNQ